MTAWPLTIIRRGERLGSSRPDYVWWQELPPEDTAEGLRSVGYEVVEVVPASRAAAAKAQELPDADERAAIKRAAKLISVDFAPEVVRTLNGYLARTEDPAPGEAPSDEPSVTEGRAELLARVCQVSDDLQIPRGIDPTQVGARVADQLLLIFLEMAEEMPPARAEEVAKDLTRIAETVRLLSQLAAISGTPLDPRVRVPGGLERLKNAGEGSAVVETVASEESLWVPAPGSNGDGDTTCQDCGAALTDGLQCSECDLYQRGEWRASGDGDGAATVETPR